jgi:hypothetical protein
MTGNFRQPQFRGREQQTGINKIRRSRKLSAGAQYPETYRFGCETEFRLELGAWSLELGACMVQNPRQNSCITMHPPSKNSRAWLQFSDGKNRGQANSINFYPLLLPQKLQPIAPKHIATSPTPPPFKLGVQSTTRWMAPIYFAKR